MGKNKPKLPAAPKQPKKRLRPTSLYPLGFDEAMRGLLSPQSKPATTKSKTPKKEDF